MLSRPPETTTLTVARCEQGLARVDGLRCDLARLGGDWQERGLLAGADGADLSAELQQSEELCLALQTGLAALRTRLGLGEMSRLAASAPVELGDELRDAVAEFHARRPWPEYLAAFELLDEELTRLEAEAEVDELLRRG